MKKKSVSWPLDGIRKRKRKSMKQNKAESLYKISTICDVETYESFAFYVETA